MMDSPITTPKKENKPSMINNTPNTTDTMLGLMSGSFLDVDEDDDTTLSPSWRPSMKKRRKRRVDPFEETKIAESELLVEDTFNDSMNVVSQEAGILDDDKDAGIVNETCDVEDDNIDSGDDFVDEPRPANANSKMNYLITYSKADVILIPDRQAFARFVIRHFRGKNWKEGDRDIIDKWAVSAESHLQTRGFHYHMALSLKSGKRWQSIDKEMVKGGIKCDFRERGGTYFGCFDYVQKLDSHMIVSSEEQHAGLTNPPRTSAAINSRRRGNTRTSASSSRESSKKKNEPPRLDLLQIKELFVKNNIRTDDQLATLAKKLALDGKEDLNRWMLAHSSVKKRTEILSTIWKIEDSLDDSERRGKSLMDLLRECLEVEHSVDPLSKRQCQGEWLPSALEVLALNSITREHFSQRVLKALENGRGKGFNLMICGPSNCAKSFLLMPLELIYRVFFQPASGSFNWLHAPKAEVIFLNDIRYEEKGDQEVMPWRQFLNLLEGCTVNIRRPGNQYDGDFAWTDSSAPVFATAETPIVRIQHGAVVQGETEQIQERWGEIMWLHYRFVGEKVNYNIVKCKRCFAELLLLNGK